MAILWWSPLRLKNMLLVKLFLLYSLGLDRKTLGDHWCEKTYIFLPRVLKENVHEMLESKIVWFIPMVFLCIHLLSQLLHCSLVHVGTIVTLSTLPCLPWFWLNRQSPSIFLHTFSRLSPSQALSADLCHRHRKAGTNFKLWQNEAYNVIFVYFINIQLIFSYSNVNQGYWKWMGFRKEAEEWIRVWKWEN